MKVIINAPDLDARMKSQLEEDINRAIPGIARRLGHVANAELILRAAVTVQGRNHNPIYSLTLSLHLPDQPVVVQKSNSDLHVLVDACEKAIKKELRRSMAKLRKEHLSRRRAASRDAFTSFSATVADLPPEPMAPPAENPIFARLRPLLGPLFSYARDHINTAVIAGELRQDYLTPDDLVDHAVLRVAENDANLLKDASRLEAELYRQIELAIAEEIEREHPNGGESIISIEDDAPEDERWGMGGVEREEREYYQPFAALRIEDILIDDHAIDPEHQLSDEEQHRLMLKYLGGFNSKARSAFYLNRVEGFDAYEIAMIQNRDEAAVLKDVDQCMEALREGWKSLATGVSKREAAKA